MPVIDLVFLVVVLAFGVIGFLKGFLDGVFDFLAPILGLWSAVIFCGKLAIQFENLVPFHWLAVVIAFVLIFIVAFLLVKIVEKIFKGIFSAGLFRQLDRILGLVFGFVEGLLVVVMILVALKAQPWFDVTELLAKSTFAKILDPLVQWSVTSFTAALGKAGEVTTQTIQESIGSGI